MPKTHEILNGKRKGHPNFPCPGPKIVQRVKKLLRIIWGNMVFKLTGEKQSQTKAKITVETEALLTFVAMCLFFFFSGGSGDEWRQRWETLLHERLAQENSTPPEPRTAWWDWSWWREIGTGTGHYHSLLTALLCSLLLVSLNSTISICNFYSEFSTIAS